MGGGISKEEYEKEMEQIWSGEGEFQPIDTQNFNQFLLERAKNKILNQQDNRNLISKVL